MGFVVAAFSAIASAVTAVVGAKAAAAIGTALLTAIATAGVNMAMSVLQRAIMGRPKIPDQPPVGVRIRVSYGEDQFQTTVLGRYATAGDVVYQNTYGSGKIPNEYMVKVIELGDLPGASLRRLKINGEWVTLNNPRADGLQEVREYVHKGKPYLWVKFYDGWQTSADQFLVNNFGNHSRMPWRADRVGTGIPYLIVVAKYNRELHRGFPEILAELDGPPLYDPRRDSSVGGVGPQRWGQPQTYERTSNLKVIEYNIWRGIHDPITGRFWWGVQDITADDLPLPQWFAAMNECDVLVERQGDDPEPQYHGGIEVTTEQNPGQIIEELNKGCQGVVAEVAGRWFTRAGPPDLPVFSFSDDDLIISDPDTMEPFVGYDRAYNGVRARWIEPEAGWEMLDAPARVNQEAIDEAGGRQVFADLHLPVVLSASHTQRLMASALKDHERMVRHTLVLGPRAAPVAPLATVAWSSRRFQYVAKQFEVGVVAPDPVGNQGLVLREVDPDDWDWESGDEIPVDIQPPVRLPAEPAPIVGFQAEAAWEADDEGTARRVAIRLLWDAADLGAEVEAIRYEVRMPQRLDLVEQDAVSHDGAEVAEGPAHDVGLLVAEDVPALVAEGVPALIGAFVEDVRRGYQLITKGILPAQDYEVRARYVRPGRSDPWSEWLPVRTFDIRLGEKDLDERVRQRLAEIPLARERANQAVEAAADMEAALDRALADMEKFGTKALTFQPDPDNPLKLQLVTFQDGEEYRGVARLDADAFLANTTIYARHIVTGAFANELPDSQMQDAESWQGLGPHAELRPRGAPPVSESLGAIRFKGTAAGSDQWHRVTSHPFVVDPGREYIVGCYLRMVGGSDGLGDMMILWLNGDGEEIGATLVAEFLSMTPGVMDAVENEIVTAPPAARQARLRWRVHVGQTSGEVEVFSAYVRRKTAGIEMEDGFLTAQHVSSEFVDALEINARQVNVTDTLRLTSSRAGFSAGKSGPDDFSTPGIYFGAGANDSFAFIAGRIRNGVSQDLRITENLGLRLLNARHAITTEAPRPAVEVHNNGWYAPPAGTTTAQITLVSGGGGGTGGRDSTPDAGREGKPGGATVVRLYDGNTFTGQQWSVPGGAGGPGGREGDTGPSDYYRHGLAGTGPLYLGASHGAGGSFTKKRPPTVGVRGGGGGGGYGSSRGGKGGQSGQFRTIQVNLKPYANPRFQVTVGQGGAGGLRSPTWKPCVDGARGGDGLVSFVNYTVEELPADVVPMAPTHRGVFNKATSGEIAHFPNLGPGYWDISVDAHTSWGLSFGYIQIGPHPEDRIWVWTAQTVSFFSSIRPSYTPNEHGRTIRYTFRSMTNWGGG